MLIHNRRSNSIATLELTCPLDSVHHLKAARDHKLGKEDYQLLLLELDHLDIVSFYDTIEMSVLSHYLSISLSAFWNCVNFIQNDFTISKSHCKKIFDLAAAVSISSSSIYGEGLPRMVCGHLIIFIFCVFLSFVSLPCPPVGSVSPYFVVTCVQSHPYFIAIVFITNNDGFPSNGQTCLLSSNLAFIQDQKQEYHLGWP